MAKKTKPVLAPINPPTAKRGNPNIGQQRKKAARSEKIGRALIGKC